MNDPSPIRPYAHHRLVVLGVSGMLLGVVILSSGCAHTGHVAPSATSSETPRVNNSSTSPASPRDSALAAYRGMWNSFVAAAKNPAGPHPGLRNYATGRALGLIKLGLHQKADAHVVTKGPLLLHPTIKNVDSENDPNKITISDCVDDSHWLEYTAAGKLASGKGAAGRHRTEALVEVKHGHWLVTAWFVEKAGTC